MYQEYEIHRMHTNREGIQDNSLNPTLKEPEFTQDRDWFNNNNNKVTQRKKMQLKDNQNYLSWSYHKLPIKFAQI